MIRVVLVEDHLLVRSGLRHLLEAKGPVRVVGEAGTCREALSLLERVQADVAILDVSLPDGTGITLCQQIRERFPGVRLLALSMHEDLEYVRGFLQAGGMGYVSKAAVDHELLDAVLAVARGERYLNPTLAMRLAMEMVREEASRPPFSPGGGGSPPSGPGAFPQGGGREARDLREDRGHLPGAGMEKLGLRSRSELLRYAARKGWI